MPSVPPKDRPTSRWRRCCLRHPCTSLVPFSMQLVRPVCHHFPSPRGALRWSTVKVQTRSHSRPGHGHGRPWETQSERWRHETSARAHVGVHCTSPPPCHSASGFWWSLGIAQNPSCPLLPMICKRNREEGRGTRNGGEDMGLFPATFVSSKLWPCPGDCCDVLPRHLKGCPEHMGPQEIV